MSTNIFISISSSDHKCATPMNHWLFSKAYPIGGWRPPSLRGQQTESNFWLWILSPPTGGKLKYTHNWCVNHLYKEQSSAINLATGKACRPPKIGWKCTMSTLFVSCSCSMIPNPQTKRHFLHNWHSNKLSYSKLVSFSGSNRIIKHENGSICPIRILLGPNLSWQLS